MRFGKPIADVITMIGRNAFQPANCDWLVLNAPAATGWFAWTIANAAKYAGKHVGFPIEHIRIAELTLGDEPYVRRNVRMSRARPLAIDDFVKIVWP